MKQNFTLTPSLPLESIRHRTIKKVTEDMEALRFNTAIAGIMEYYNALHAYSVENGSLGKEHIETLLLLLACFAPHMSEELYQRLRAGISNFESIHTHPWPIYDERYLVSDTATVVVQVNGKVRDILKVQSAKCKVQSYVEEEAKKLEKVQKYLKNKTIRQVIFVKDKLINFVVS